MHPLGIEFISVFGLPPVEFVQLAAERGLKKTTIEMAPGMVIGDLPTALVAIEHCGAQLRLCLDTMHWSRSGYGAADIDALAPDVIGYVQLSDHDSRPGWTTTWRKRCTSGWLPAMASFHCGRSCPLSPPDVVVGLEVPMRALAEAGVSAADRLRPCVAGARELMP